MMSQREVIQALEGWRAAQFLTAESQGTGNHFDDPHRRGLVEGYVGALEMVLRWNPGD